MTLAFRSQYMNTLRPSEETWVDQGKEGDTNNHQDKTSLHNL